MPWSQFTKALIIFIAGLASGWWLAQRFNLPSGDVAVSRTAPDTTTAPAQINSTDIGVVWLTVEFDDGSQIIPGTIIDNGKRILASLYDIYPANSVFTVDATTQETQLLNIAAADDASGLIVLDYSGRANHALPISAEHGSLYLGRSVQLLLPQKTINGEVDSALLRNSLGHESYAVKLDSQPSHGSGPLFAKDDKNVVGFMTGSRTPHLLFAQSTPRLSAAVDATDIRNLLERTSNQALTITEFAQYWAGQPGGLRVTLGKLIDRSEWTRAFQVAKQLWQTDTDNTSSYTDVMTLMAYLAAHRWIDNNDPQSAMAVIDEMQQMFGNERPWCVVEARARHHRGRWRHSMNSIEQCLTEERTIRHELASTAINRALNTTRQFESQEALTAQARNVAIAAANDSTVSGTVQRTLLEQALRYQDHAVLYRLLGDNYYEAGNYDVAQRHYQSAIALDGSVAAQLGNRLQNSQQRAQTAPVAEVPFEDRRGALVVTAYLNSSSQPFRFLLDTGATYSAVSTATILRLGLTDIFAFGAPLIELESAAGPIYVQRFTLDAMRIGAATVEQVPVVVLEELEGFDGLVGLSFLQHFDVSLDQQAGKLILTRR